MIYDTEFLENKHKLWYFFLSEERGGIGIIIIFPPYIPRLNSTIPSSPALSQNSDSKELAATAWRWGKAARARGRAKMDVVRIKPVFLLTTIFD